MNWWGVDPGLRPLSRPDPGLLSSAPTGLSIWDSWNSSLRICVHLCLSVAKLSVSASLWLIQARFTRLFLVSYASPGLSGLTVYKNYGIIIAYYLSQTR